MTACMQTSFRLIKKENSRQRVEQGETGKRMLKITEKLYDQSIQGIFILRNQDIKEKQRKKIN